MNKNKQNLSLWLSFLFLATVYLLMFSRALSRFFGEKKLAYVYSYWIIMIIGLLLISAFTKLRRLQIFITMPFLASLFANLIVMFWFKHKFGNFPSVSIMGFMFISLVSDLFGAGLWFVVMGMIGLYFLDSRVVGFSRYS